MRCVLAIATVMAAGCTQPAVTPAMRSLMVQCMCDAAVAVNRVDHAAPSDKPPPSPASCCTECNGTGKVRSGDGIEKVSCDCPDSCECKRRGRASPQPCPRCLGFGKVLSQDGKRINRCESCGGCSDGSCRPTN